MVVNVTTKIKVSPIAEKIRPKSICEQTREIINSYIPGKPLTKKQIEAVSRAHYRRFNYIRRQICEMFERYYNTPISQTHENKLNEFYLIMKDKNLNAKTLKQIKNIVTEGELKLFIMQFPSIVDKLEITPVYKSLMQHKKRGFPLEAEQLFHEKKCYWEDCIATLFRMFAESSKDPEILKVEKLLKEKYGVQAFLNDDIDRAINILASVKKLKENNIPIPKEYIVSDSFIGGRALSTDKHTVLLSSSETNYTFKDFKHRIKKDPVFEKEQILLEEWARQCEFKSWEPCDAEELVETHEACHFLHLPFLAFMHQKTSKFFADTVKKLSGYAAFKIQNHNEVFAELKAKSLYETLNPEEQHLLNILDGKH